MKRILVLIVLFLIAGGAYRLWTAHNVPAPVAAPENTDARALSAAEQAAFLPLVCGGLSAGSDGFAHNCTSLPGYPSDDYGGAGTGLGITLTSIIEGHLSNATADEAYVSYQGSFESHADDFGGGILFTADGKGGWKLDKWVQGGVMDGCLALTPQGRARMLCLRGFTGQGETDTALMLTSIPDPSGKTVLSASDLRETMDPNGNCGLRKSADQDVLLGIDSIARSGLGYTAQIDYVPAAIAEAACQAKDFTKAAVSKTVLSLMWNGNEITIQPAYQFAPSETN